MNKFILFLTCVLSGMGLVLCFIALASPAKAVESVKNMGRGLRHSPVFRFTLVGGLVVTFGGVCVHPILGLGFSIVLSTVLLLGLKAPKVTISK